MNKIIETIESGIKGGSISSLINRIAELRDEKDSLNEQLKEVNKYLTEAEAKLLRLMDESDLEKVSTDTATAFTKTTNFWKISNKVSFYKWAVNNGRFEMLQSRLNSAPANQMFEESNQIPEGTEVTTGLKLNFRRK